MFWNFLRKNQTKSEMSRQLYYLKKLLKIFGEFLENHPQQRISKVHNYVEHELWMSNEATFKFPMWEKKFSQRNFLSQKRFFLPIITTVHIRGRNSFFTIKTIQFTCLHVFISWTQAVADLGVSRREQLFCAITFYSNTSAIGRSSVKELAWKF